LLAIFGFRPSIAAQQSSLKSTKSEKIGRLLMPKRMIAAVAALALSSGAALAQELLSRSTAAWSFISSSMPIR
jgi:hypothetical protein